MFYHQFKTHFFLKRGRPSSESLRASAFSPEVVSPSAYLHFKQQKKMTCCCANQLSGMFSKNASVWELNGNCGGGGGGGASLLLKCMTS